MPDDVDGSPRHGGGFFGRHAAEVVQFDPQGRIRISSIDNPAVTGVSAAVFTIQ
jgi:hypothetical protein